MSIEDLARRIIEGNAAGRLRSLDAHTIISEAMTTGADIDVEEIFRDPAERDEPSEVTGATESVDGDAGGTASGA